MGVADACIDFQIALAGAPLPLGSHVRTAVNGMNIERRIERQQLQRNVMGPEQTSSTLAPRGRCLWTAVAKMLLQHAQVPSEATALPWS